MNILNNRNKRTSIFKAVALCLIAAMSFTLVSCDDDMDIQQSYPYGGGHARAEQGSKGADSGNPL
jgi:hypothetical protein